MSRTGKAGRSRILLVIAGLCAGGAERQMAMLARGLDRNRYEVGLLIFNAADKVHYQDVFDQPLWFRALGLSRRHKGSIGLGLGMALGIRQAVADFKPDLIHTSLFVAGVAMRATGLFCFPNIPVVTSSIRGDFVLYYARWHRFIERMLCRRSAAIIVNSDHIRQQLLSNWPLPSKRVFTVENGIDPRFSAGSALPPKDWPDGGRIALVVGRLEPVKNHLAMISALKTLNELGCLDDWSFALVGEGRLHAQIVNAARDLPRFKLFPPTDDLLPYYRNADLLLLPSLSEGVPNVALEAQACGVPVAITPTANAADVVSTGSGWIMEGDLASALSQILETPVNELKRRGNLARIDVLDRFGDKRMIGRTVAAYQFVLNKTGNPPALPG